MHLKVASTSSGTPIKLRFEWDDMQGIPVEKGLPFRYAPNYRGRVSRVSEYFSLTDDRHLRVESTVEADWAHALDRDPTVTGIYPQPHQLTDLDYSQEKRSIRHTPDFLATFVDHRIGVIDCKTRRGVRERDLAKFSMARAVYAHLGWSYRVVFELSKHHSANLRAMRAYGPAWCFDDLLAADLMAGLNHPMSLIEAAGRFGGTRRVYPTLFHLIWHGQLSIDWDRQLAPSTQVQVALPSFVDAVSKKTEQAQS